MSQPPGPKGPQRLDDALLDGVVGGSAIGFGGLANGAMGVGFTNRTLGADFSPDPPPPPPEPEPEGDEGGTEGFREQENPGGGTSDAGVKVAPGDQDGDGIVDVQVDSGPTGGPGSSPGPQGGVYVPASDADGDGRPDF